VQVVQVVAVVEQLPQGEEHREQADVEEAYVLYGQVA